MTTLLDPAVSPPVMSYTDKILQNAEVAAKSGSTYVVLVAGILGAIYASMSVAQQTQLVEAWPLLKGWTPIITLVIAFVVAKLKPSDAVSSQTKALIDEVARLRLNVFLRSRGSPELPPPEPTPLPVPASVVPVPARVPWPFPTADTLPADKAWQAQQAAKVTPTAPPPAPPPPVETVTVTEMEPHVDIKLPRVDPPAPLPIDPKLLLSLVRQYLEQVTK